VAVRVKLWKRAAVVVDPLTAPYVQGEPLPAGEPCANCGDRTPGNFCRHCGQARRVVHVSLREMLADFLDDQLALNSRLPKTVAFLLLRPGFLTREYLRGRIASYIRPLRLYLGTSVLFFLVFALAARSGGWLELNLGPDPTETARQAGATRPPAAPDPHETTRQASAAGVPLPPPSPRAVPIQTVGPSLAVHGMGAFGDTLSAKAVRFMEMSRAERQQVLLNGLQDEGPRAMFAMLPIFAFLLKLLYVRKKRFYVEHFVFALHFHAFAFLLLTLLVAVEEQFPAVRETQLANVATGWIFLYLFLGMKKVYGEGFFRTGMKYGALLSSYFFILMLGLVGTAMAVVYFL
jgi:hypothetical protein